MNYLRALLATTLLSLSGWVHAETAPEPLPLSVVAELPSFDWSSQFELSPDGQSLTYSYKTNQSLPYVPGRYTANGVPRYSDIDQQVHIEVVDTEHRDAQRLGAEGSTRWSPVWSPDGKRVAYFSDEGGVAGVWIWEAQTGRSWRFPEVIPRPMLLAETLAWTADSKYLLCTVLPADVDVATANAADLKSSTSFPPTVPGEPAVIVMPPGADAKRRQPAAGASPPPAVRANDLALLDVQSRTVRRLGPKNPGTWAAPSPNGKYVARAAAAFADDGIARPHQDLVIHDVHGGEVRTLHLPQPGRSWAWSPRSDRIAYYATEVGPNQIPTTRIQLASLRDAAVRSVGGDRLPAIRPQHLPLWDARGESLYVIGTDAATKSADEWYFDALDKVWRVDVDSGRVRVAAHPQGQEVTAMVTRSGQPVIWSNARGRIWVLARAHGAVWPTGSVLHEIGTDKGLPLRSFDMNTGWHSKLAGNDTTGEIAFISTDQQRPPDIWLLDTKTGDRRQVTRLGAALEPYRLGQSRVLEYQDDQGRALRGALLLPPDYQPGQRLPLVMWVMGHAHDSQFAAAFGFYGNQGGMTSIHNMQVLATRGYAVMIPDVPQRPGEQLKDTLTAVMAAVDAAVAQGYADSERLAIMGYSRGAYAALGTITQTNRFKAAVLTGAAQFPDLLGGYLLGDPRSTSNMEMFESTRGQDMGMAATPWQDRDRYLRNSAALYFDQVRTPVLIGHGSADDPLGAGATYAALRRLKVPVEYRLYEHEEHTMQGTGTVLDFWRRRLEFLAEHLQEPGASERTTAVR